MHRRRHQELADKIGHPNDFSSNKNPLAHHHNPGHLKGVPASPTNSGGGGGNNNNNNSNPQPLPLPPWLGGEGKPQYVQQQLQRSPQSSPFSQPPEAAPWQQQQQQQQQQPPQQQQYQSAAPPPQTPPSSFGNYALPQSENRQSNSAGPGYGRRALISRGEEHANYAPQPLSSSNFSSAQASPMNPSNNSNSNPWEMQQMQQQQQQQYQNQVQNPSPYHQQQPSAPRPKSWQEIQNEEREAARQKALAYQRELEEQREEIARRKREEADARKREEYEFEQRAREDRERVGKQEADTMRAERENLQGSTASMDDHVGGKKGRRGRVNAHQSDPKDPDFQAELEQQREEVRRRKQMLAEKEKRDEEKFNKRMEEWAKSEGPLGANGPQQQHQQQQQYNSQKRGGSNRRGTEQYGGVDDDRNDNNSNLPPWAAVGNNNSNDNSPNQSLNNNNSSGREDQNSFGVNMQAFANGASASSVIPDGNNNSGSGNFSPQGQQQPDLSTFFQQQLLQQQMNAAHGIIAPGIAWAPGGPNGVPYGYFPATTNFVTAAQLRNGPSAVADMSQQQALQQHLSLPTVAAANQMPLGGVLSPQFRMMPTESSNEMLQRFAREGLARSAGQPMLGDGGALAQSPPQNLEQESRFVPLGGGGGGHDVSLRQMARGGGGGGGGPEHGRRRMDSNAGGMTPDGMDGRSGGAYPSPEHDLASGPSTFVPVSGAAPRH